MVDNRVFKKNGIAKIYIQVEDTTPQWHKTNNNNNSNNFTLIQYEQWNYLNLKYEVRQQDF